MLTFPRQAPKRRALLRVLGVRRAVVYLLTVEGRAHAGRRVGGAGGSAVSEDHDDDDDERARERAAEAGGKRHEQRCVSTYDARPMLGIESHSTCEWARACVRGRADTLGLSIRRRVRA
jgi:hypothetical protein